MSEAVEGNDRQLFFWRLACIIAAKHILEGLIWSGVVHHLAVVLYENPIPTLPKVGEVSFELFSGLFEFQNPECQVMWDGYGSRGHFGFGFLAELLTLDDCSGFRDTDHICLIVNIRKFKGKYLTFAEASVDSQVEKNADLFWY